MTTQDRLDPARTALLVFDMLKGHIKKNPDTQARYAPVIDNTVRLLATARAAGMMVIYATAHHRPDNSTSASLVTDTDNRLRPLSAEDRSKIKPMIAGGTWDAQVIDELKPQPQDYMVPKFRWNAFYQTYLDLALRNRNVNTVILCGGSTDVGVASTAYCARDMDYNLVIVSDACTSPEQDNHDQFMQRIFPRMGRVRTAEQVMQMLA